MTQEIIKLHVIFVASAMNGVLTQHFHQPHDFQQNSHGHQHQVLHTDINLERE